MTVLYFMPKEWLVRIQKMLLGHGGLAINYVATPVECMIPTTSARHHAHVHNRTKPHDGYTEERKMKESGCSNFLPIPS